MINNMKDAFSVEGKKVLVTGGGRGIGKGIVQAYAQSGADVAIMARSDEASLKTIEELAPLGGKYKYYQGDVTKPEDAERVINTFYEEFGGLDVLVNNAGICYHIRTLDIQPHDFKEWNEVMNVNSNGVFYMSYFAGHIMTKQKSGSIINVSSGSGRVPNTPQYQISYNASKASCSQITRSLALEWAEYGVRVNAIEPGYTNTELLQVDTERDAQWLKSWEWFCITRRFCEPIELGALCVYLGSEAASYMTGAVIPLDGGNLQQMGGPHERLLPMMKDWPKAW